MQYVVSKDNVSKHSKYVKKLLSCGCLNKVGEEYVLEMFRDDSSERVRHFGEQFSIEYLRQGELAGIEWRRKNENFMYISGLKMKRGISLYR